MQKRYLYIHGGGFGGGCADDSVYTELFDILGSSLISIDFPLNEGVTAAIDFIKKKIIHYKGSNGNEDGNGNNGNGNGNRIILVGVSSGGWFALQVSTMKEVDGLICLAPVPDPVKRLEAVTPAKRRQLLNNTLKMFGTLESAQEFAKKNPIKRARYHPLIIVGREDENVPVNLSLTLPYDDIIIIDGATHTDICMARPTIVKKLLREY
jgi:hypothetical protein